MSVPVCVCVCCCCCCSVKEEQQQNKNDKPSDSCTLMLTELLYWPLFPDPRITLRLTAGKGVLGKGASVVVVWKLLRPGQLGPEGFTNCTSLPVFAMLSHGSKPVRMLSAVRDPSSYTVSCPTCHVRETPACRENTGRISVSYTHLRAHET